MAASQTTARAERIADVLAQDPARWLTKLTNERDPRTFEHMLVDLESALRLLAKRADARALWAASSALHGIATEPQGRRSAAAAPLLKLFGDPSMLLPIAERLLARDDGHRDAARTLVLRARVAGAYALYGARVKLAADERARGPFIEAMRALGEVCWPVVRAALEKIPEAALTGAHPAAAQLAEDLLLCVPTVRDESAGHLAAKYVHAVDRPLCVAAARAVARLWLERARPILLALLADDDDARRTAGLVGLRQLGAVDAHAVRKLVPILKGEVEASLELRLATVAVLSVVTDEARPIAVPLLAQLVRDPSTDDATVLEAAKSLTRLLRNEARAVIGDRADRSGEALKGRLYALMEATKGGALVE
jgi:serine/threonine-protein kinase